MLMPGTSDRKMEGSVLIATTSKDKEFNIRDADEDDILSYEHLHTSCFYQIN
jgi:hypothetical protein